MRALRSPHNQIPILDQGILRNLKRSSPGGDQASIRDNGILRSSRSNVHDLELMRSLRSVHMDVGSNVHSDGLMRSLRSIRNEGIMRSLRSLLTCRAEAYQILLDAEAPLWQAHQHVCIR